MELRDASGTAIERRENGLALVGDFDIFHSGDVAAAIDERASSGAAFTVDLTRCTYVDSTILSVLVRAANSYAGRLEMIGPTGGNVARILSLTKLDRILPLI